MKLNVNLIPHEHFHKGVWLNNKSIPWYFFHQTNRNYEIPKNQDFYKTLDKPLKMVTKLLHNNGIPTTPSCSGHIKSENFYKDVYKSLKNAERKIRNDYMIFTDVENGKNYLYKNKNYKLPWSEEDFLKKIKEYQKIGVIGLVDDNEYFYDNLSGGNYELIHDDGITILKLKSENPKGCDKNWESIYKEFIKLL